jgi:polyether ionophore transport system permease protein
VGLALRLQRGSVIAWSVGLFLIGIVYGAIANDVEDFVGDNDTVKELMAPGSGTSLTDSYLSRSLLIAVLIGGGYAISSALRLRSEETALHAEPVLATPISRHRWAASQLAVTLAGSVVVLTAAGLGTGVAYGIAAGEPGQVPRLVGAALAYTPAIWVLVGLATALFGLAPRSMLVTWGLLTVCFVVGMLDEILDLPTWIKDLSPFQHTPQLPAANPTILPLASLAAAAATLTWVGLIGFRHRDVG